MDVAEGRAAIEKYVFGGHYGGSRVPRGVAPEVVSQLLKERLPGNTDADDMAKALDVMRFYECADVLPVVKPLLARSPEGYEELLKKLCLCQMFGDLGTREQADEAAAYLNRSLAPSTNALDAAAVLLETLVVLAPAGDVEVFAKHLSIQVAELAKEQQKDEASMAAFDKADAIRRNDLPRARFKIAYKLKLLAQEPPVRRLRLVRLYLGQEPVTDSYFQTWSGRLLRQEVHQGNGPGIFAELAKVLDSVDPEMLGKERAADVPVLRAGRALDYFNAPLTDRQKANYKKAKSGTMDFLWDE